MATDLITCPTKLLHPDAQPPVQSKDLAAGHDIRCVGGLQGLSSELWDEIQRAEWAAFGERGYVDLKPGDAFLFRTGFAQAIEEDYCCLLWDRSGMGGVKIIHRCAGVIDPDYRGEWFVRLVNHSTETHRIKVGEKIVQGVYQKRVVAACPIVTDLDETERGEGGFGSTDTPGSEGVEPGSLVDTLPDHLLSTQAPAPVVDEDDAPTPNHPVDSVGASASAQLDDTDVITDDVLLPDPPEPVVDEVTVPDDAPPAPAGWKYGRVVVYDGRNSPHAMACMRDRQYASAIEWITRDREFFPNGAPQIIPETLRSVPGRQAVAFNPLIPTEG